MRLKTSQELLFKTITRYDKQEESEQLIVNSTKLTPEKRLSIYQNAYRLRFEDAILDDYEVSIHILGDSYHKLFQKFCDNCYSQMKSLNYFTKEWMLFIESQDVDPQIKALTQFEWKMVESFYSHIADGAKHPKLVLSEEPPAAMRLDNSVGLMETDWPLIETYETKGLQDGNRSFIIFWTEKSSIFYRAVNSKEFLFAKLLQQENNLNNIFLKLNTLGLKEEELAHFLQSSIANFMKYGFLLRA